MEASVGDSGSRGPERDPYLRALLELRLPGRRARYLAPHSLFASHAIDPGTMLLLGHLPAGEPRSFLDLGSGYGVLGLEVAARFPGARGLLVDRDLLAVEFSRRNAALHGAQSVEVAPSLGYRGLPAGHGPFDWILANVPARAGGPVLEHFIACGRKRLAAGGELRLVAIAPLAEAVERVARSRAFPCVPAARTRRHAVFAFPAPEAGGAAAGPEAEGDEVYERDGIRLRLPEELRLVRPSDLADEPHRLADAIPLLAEHLEEPPGPRILVFRSGYGLVPALVLSRFPGARVVAQDRDLLATAFTRRNCAPEAERLRVEERLRIAELAPLGPFDLILGELSPPLGRRATLLELAQARELLAAGGRALVLGLAKHWQEWLKPAASRLGLGLRARRGPAALIELRSSLTLRSC